VRFGDSHEAIRAVPQVAAMGIEETLSLAAR